jgi:DNA-binding CsgD family transcriptional regulator
MLLLLKGKTIVAVASILGLSPRTVEYYVKNMKSKLGCRTKFELLDAVHASEFISEAHKLAKLRDYPQSFKHIDAINQPPFVSEDDDR